MTVKSVKAIDGSNAVAILTDGEHNYTLTLADDSYYDNYQMSKIFTPHGWLSAGNSPTNMTLEFEMDNLTEISYRPCEEQTYNEGYGNENTITVFCDDEQVYHGNANISADRRHSGYIHINFNDYSGLFSKGQPSNIFPVYLTLDTSQFEIFLLNFECANI